MLSRACIGGRHGCKGPYNGAKLRVQWRAQAIWNAGGRGRRVLISRRGDVGAIAPPHQDAILRVTKIRELHRQPHANAGQKGCKKDRCHIRRHPVAVIVWSSPVPCSVRLIPRRELRITLSACIPDDTWRVRKRAWTKFENLVVFVVHSRLPVGHLITCFYHASRGLRTASPSLGLLTRGELFRHPAHHIEFVVGAHVGHAGHPVR